MCFFFPKASSTSDEKECAITHLSGTDKGISVITMQRPRYKNALGRQMLREFCDALHSARFDSSIRTLILQSSVDGVFCAGADLKERASMTKEQTAAFVFELRKSFTDLENLPMPTIACIEGSALGGGLEMALACDIRIAAKKTAVLGLPETSLAIIPGAGGTQRLPRIVGLSRAKDLIFTARKLNAEESEQIGLVNYAVDSGKTFEKALELARQIITKGPVAIRAAKIAVNEGMQVDRTTGMIIEQQCYAQVIPTKDRLEGLAAFKEKRSPLYTGE